MRFARVASWIAAIFVAGAATGATGCVVREATPVNPGYGYPYGYPPPGYDVAQEGTPTPYEVPSEAPDALDEQEPASPGDGFDWIAGYWHWNGNDWVWVGGRWEREQEGYVYVQPFYDYSGGRMVYTPGYWSRRDHMPPGWRVSRGGNGRPPTISPPPAWHNPAPAHPVYGYGGRPTGPVPQGPSYRPPMTTVGPNRLPSQPPPSTTIYRGADPEPSRGEPEPAERGEPEPLPPAPRTSAPAQTGYRPSAPVQSGGHSAPASSSHGSSAAHHK